METGIQELEDSQQYWEKILHKLPFESADYKYAYKLVDAKVKKLYSTKQNMIFLVGCVSRSMSFDIMYKYNFVIVVDNHHKVYTSDHSVYGIHEGVKYKDSALIDAGLNELVLVKDLAFNDHGYSKVWRVSCETKSGATKIIEAKIDTRDWKDVL